jgi:hypothetical protein
MLPDSMIKTFQQYRAVTPAHQQSTASWSRYFNARSGGALDAKPKPKPRSTSRSPQPRPSRMPDFYETYGVRPGEKIGGGMAFDQMERRGGNVIAPNGQPCPEVLEDEAQHLVETTDAEPPDGHGIHGRAPPAGPFDEPRQQRVQEPRLATDPPTSERQARAMHAAAEGRSTLNIPKSVGEHFVGKADAALGSVEAGQQGSEVGPEGWETTRGRDQAHEDEPEDEKLIRRVLSKLGFKSGDIDEAIARDRASRRRMAGDAALSGRSFHNMYPEARGLTDGLPAFTPRPLW